MNVKGRYGKRRTGGLDSRPLHLKIRVVTTTPQTAETTRLLLHRAIETGIVPPGIEIRWLDWQKGSHGKVSRGVMTSGLRKALRDFYGAITGGEARFEKVREERR
jgi:hypothetical protein